MATQCIGDSENLGRGCFDSGDSSRSKPRVQFIKRSFLRGLMSVDRLDSADVQTLCSVHDAEGMGRVPPKMFYGWYVFSAALVRSADWCVYPEPTCTNSGHAEVCRPNDHDEDNVLQKCTEIASQTIWQARLMSQEAEEFLARASDSLS